MISLKLIPLDSSAKKSLITTSSISICARAKLVIELDGSQHYEKKELLRDIIRTDYIKAHGLTVIRIPNNEITRNFEGVCEYIDVLVQDLLGK